MTKLPILVILKHFACAINFFFVLSTQPQQLSLRRAASSLWLLWPADFQKPLGFLEKCRSVTADPKHLICSLIYFFPFSRLSLRTSSRHKLLVDVCTLQFQTNYKLYPSKSNMGPAVVSGFRGACPPAV